MTIWLRRKTFIASSFLAALLYILWRNGVSTGIEANSFKMATTTPSEPRNALIIGAKQGIGLNLSKKLQERGWRVFATVRSLDKDKASTEEVPHTVFSRHALQFTPQPIDLEGILDFSGCVQILQVDVKQEETIKVAAESFGTRALDLLVVCAGVGPNPIDMWEHSAEILMEKFQANTVGPFLAVKHFRDALQRATAGKVITISSNLASLSNTQDNRRGGSIGYRLSKTALNQLTVSLSRTFSFEQTSITVHAIHPGWIPTTMTGFTGPDDMETQISLMVDTIEKLGPSDSGRFLTADGEDFPW
ncbi:unnamed protein product [Clonostachys rosea f. rosea IK726]|uniref:Uncharacterized protein n=2 Tax=Bionectria ochroleuca TaxID=29856 RepID=A0A0B7KMZ6_BIOOC|nr:unnamed protein product [Clonostachys rosea f. rosea IK726]